jgi:predicted dehydrogenase
MNTPIHLSVLGDGTHATALAQYGAPLGRIRLVEANDPKVQAVLIDLPAGQRSLAIVAALRAGHLVLSPPPVALDADTLAEMRAAEQSGGGLLLPAGEIAHSEAGKRGLAAMRAASFGRLHSIYLALRQPRGEGADVLDTLLPEALDFVLAAIAEDFATVRVNAAALFGASYDSAVILLRSTADTVVTIELARCLPATLPAPGLGEIEIDAMGAHQSVRIVPQASAVRVQRDDGVAARPWMDPPVLTMMRALEAAFDARGEATSGLTRAARAQALTQAIRDTL